MYDLTVYTPTYNRGRTLKRLYSSLISQTNKEFTWLIIDDGSIDNTKQLVSEWINEGIITINYVFKTNGGKHTATRLAYSIIKTKYLILIDSH